MAKDEIIKNNILQKMFLSFVIRLMVPNYKANHILQVLITLSHKNRCRAKIFLTKSWIVFEDLSVTKDMREISFTV